MIKYFRVVISVISVCQLFHCGIHLARGSERLFRWHRPQSVYFEQARAAILADSSVRCSTAVGLPVRQCDNRPKNT